MKRKIFKLLLIMLLIILLPIMIVLITLYVNDAYLLNKLEQWLSINGNLTAFISLCVLYLPFVSFVWNAGILISKSIRESEEHKKIKMLKSVKIYDDGKFNSIYWDNINNRIHISFKSPVNEDLKSLGEKVCAELKEQIKQHEISKLKK